MKRFTKTAALAGSIIFALAIALLPRAAYASHDGDQGLWTAEFWLKLLDSESEAGRTIARTYAVAFVDGFRTAYDPSCGAGKSYSTISSMVADDIRKVSEELRKKIHVSTAFTSTLLDIGCKKPEWVSEPTSVKP